ncbi:hypothetical protein RI367_006008 [Sorochytrium milnesiophthora]
METDTAQQLSTSTYTLDQLRNKQGLPLGVDPAQLETYLSDAEFVKAFNMDRAAFQKLPAWKQKDSKKKVGLF